MEYTYLGRTGLKVSRLCLGTMNLGRYTDEKEAFKIMDAALDAGINFFDTANIYGGPGNKGRTEEVIGRWFSQGNNRRERAVLATKVYGPMEDENDGPNGGGGMSAYKVRRHLKGSLERLQTDHIELYQIHHIDRQATWDEVWGVFEPLVNQGVVDYIGSSNFAGWHLVKAQAEAEKRRFLGLVSEQHKFNLLCRLPELEVLPAAKDLGISVVAWSPLSAGLLGGNALSNNRGDRTAKQVEKVEEHRSQLEQFSSLCAELGESDSNVALAWILHQPALAAPIIGPRTFDQFEQSLRAVEIELDDSTLQRLDEIFPGPGGHAPEAYAW